jgi:hypothetical protein
MAIEMPKSGIDAIGDMVSWVGRFCLFYERREEAHLPGEQECRCGRILSTMRPFSVR